MHVSSFCILVSMEQMKRSRGHKIMQPTEHYSRNISIKVLLKYPQWLSGKCDFSVVSI